MTSRRRQIAEALFVKWCMPDSIPTELAAQAFHMADCFEATSKAGAANNVPVDGIVQAYAAHCTGLQPVLEVTQSLRSQIARAFRSERKPLSWWEGYFERCAKVPWFNGENPEGWTATLPFLVEKRGEVLSGKFSKRSAKPKSALEKAAERRSS